MPSTLSLPTVKTRRMAKGITRRIYHQLIQMGIDVLTMGNHTFAKSDLFNFIDEADRLVRPMNLSPTDAGKGVRVFVVKGLRIAVVNLCGEVFMHDITESPFSCMERVLKDVEADLYLVDLHGEATSEKIAFTYAFSGRHRWWSAPIPMCRRPMSGSSTVRPPSAIWVCAGAYTSVLGRDVKEIVTRFTTEEKTRYTIAEGPGIFCGVIVNIDEQTCRAHSIERIQIRPEQEERFSLQ